MIRVKVMMTIDVDPEEYPIPSDGKVEEEIESYVTDVIHELDGVKIKHIRSVSEEK
tara:strand:- start:215 stop:382 length:168 start_codon:yes stop_codon:yes gene_type:complete